MITTITEPGQQSLLDLVGYPQPNATPTRPRRRFTFFSMSRIAYPYPDDWTDELALRSLNRFMDHHGSTPLEAYEQTLGMGCPLDLADAAFAVVEAEQ